MTLWYERLIFNRCDLNRPCQTCRDRDHAELCSYNPPNKRKKGAQSDDLIPKVEDETSNAGYVTLGRGEFDFICRKLNALEDSMADMRRQLGLNANDQHALNEAAHVSNGNVDPMIEERPHVLSHADVHGVHMKNEAGEMVHLGAGSIPAMLYALQMDQNPAQKPEIQEMLGKTVLPLFALDNESATYPFVDLWGLPHGSLARAQELAKALPNDSQMLNLFRCYSDLGHIVYPSIVSPEQLESDLTLFLINRSAQSGFDEGVTEQLIYGKSYTWLALLFAVLAGGCQCSSMPRKERELTSQVYGKLAI